ncbi:MAG: DNA repair exonuclease [Candidatus Bathyarchaeia archaeon]
MRFAHLADVHLGHRQYGLWERALDYAKAFMEAIEEILARKLSFVLIAGDLFDSRLPAAFAVRTAFRELSRLKAAGIPVYAIRGNHDAVETVRGGNYLHLLADAGLVRYLEVPDRPYEDLKVGSERARILGFGCSPEAFLETNLEAVKRAIDPSADANILLLHQTFDRVEVREQSYLLPTAPFHDERFKAVRYYAMGHVHQLAARHPELPAYYPGSLETWDLEDAETIEYTVEKREEKRTPQRQKGFLLVELEGEQPRVEPVTLPNRRAVHAHFKYAEVDPKEASEHVLSLASSLDLDEAVVNITISGVVKRGSRRSDLMVSEIRRVLTRPLKVRVNNNLSYAGKGSALYVKGQVGVETALHAYFLDELRDPAVAESRAKVAIQVFHLLEQREEEKAKEVLEAAV